jgi:23S rRNA (adenine2503-C2)-methyltransferase
MNDNREKVNIRTLNPEEIALFFEKHKEKPFRAKQVYQWLWEKSAHSFDEMTNLSKAIRELLSESFIIHSMNIDKTQKSEDGTIKNVFSLYDKNKIEGVLIPANDRMTACVSSQVGCSLTCGFCATGKMERLRNLEAGEIYDQVVMINEQALKHYNMPLSNIVYMGMGEPLLNYANVLKSIEHITSPDGLNMASKRITVSTAGIAKMIAKLGDDQVKFNLALSLHAANDEKRSKIMPINDSNSLEQLESALKYFYQKTGTQITFEYIIFRDFNDSIADAAELLRFCRKVSSKVNIIEYNSIDDEKFEKASDEKTGAFKNYLERNGVIVNLRRSRGKDIAAACGQLANKKS